MRPLIPIAFPIRRMAFLRTVLILAIALSLQGCAAYYNTFFNAEKAYKQALKMRAERQARNPEDTTVVTPEEKAKLIRAVTKSSKVLELYPNNAKYAPRAVFLIAESQRLMEDYPSAALKYSEYIRYFPKEEKIPLAKVRMAQSLYMDGKRLAAREALAEVMASDPRGEVRREALLLSARMQIDDRSGAEGLALYGQLLQEDGFTAPEARNEVNWRAAVLAFELGEWEKARKHALAAEAGVAVPMHTRFRNRKLAVLAVYRLGRYGEGLAEVRGYQKLKEYRPFRADLKVLEALGTDGQGDWPGALRHYRAAVKLGPRTAAASEAWYRIGIRVLDVENREDSARAWFDSAAAAGRGFEYGLKGAEVAEALARLAELRRMDSAHAASFRRPAKGVDTLAVRDTAAADSSARSGSSGSSGESAASDQAAAEASDSRDNGDGREAAVKPVEIPKPPSVHYASFLIAELFHFRLPKPDSARVHLNRIVADTLEDSLYSRRAFYALAWLEKNEFDNKGRADSLYRVLMVRYPATEWAKQAEINLGLPSTVQTSDDKAHRLFLTAEERRLKAEEAGAVQKPGPAIVAGYRLVSETYPQTADAAKAVFVLAFLSEQEALAQPGQAAADTAKAAYSRVRDQYPGTPYAEVAASWIEGMDRVANAGTSEGDTRESGETTEEEEEGSSGDALPRSEQIDAASEQDLY
jgi:outer membrane protein assembly factor BamD (BamD/ComL family)